MENTYDTQVMDLLMTLREDDYTPLGALNSKGATNTLAWRTSRHVIVKRHWAAVASELNLNHLKVVLVWESNGTPWGKLKAVAPDSITDYL